MEEHERKKKKKDKKKEKKRKLEEEEAAAQREIEEKKKENPHGVLMKKIAINVAPDLQSAKARDALAPLPAMTTTMTGAREEESKGRVVLIDQRRRGFAPSGAAAMASFSLDSDPLAPAATELVEFVLQPSPYANSTSAGRPTLSGRYYTRQVPQGPVVPGPLDLQVDESLLPSEREIGSIEDEFSDGNGMDAPDAGVIGGMMDTGGMMAKMKQMGKNFIIDPMQLVEVRAADLRKKTHAEEIEAAFDMSNPAPSAEVAAKFWNPKLGTTVQTTKGTKLHKRKHQINTLAVEAAAKEHELNKWRATGKAHLQQAKARYGW